jgi:hypothetical protein
LKGSNPLIDKVYLYVDSPALAINDGITDKITDAKGLAGFRSLVQAQASIYWVSPYSELKLRQSGNSLIHDPYLKRTGGK